MLLSYVFQIYRKFNITRTNNILYSILCSLDLKPKFLKQKSKFLRSNFSKIFGSTSSAYNFSSRKNQCGCFWFNKSYDNSTEFFGIVLSISDLESNLFQIDLSLSIETDYYILNDGSNLLFFWPFLNWRNSLRIYHTLILEINLGFQRYFLRHL
jgi:hypothetical protein